MFRSPSFKKKIVHLFLHFSGLITIRFVLDPALNLYFDLTIRGTDTVCIDWTLQVPLSFKWVEQSHHSSYWRIGLLVRWSIASWRCCPTGVPLWLCWGAGHQHEIAYNAPRKFQLLTKRSFLSLHHDNNHSFKANSLLNRSCPRRYVERGPDMMNVVAGDVLRTVSIRLLKSLFSV